MLSTTWVSAARLQWTYRLSTTSCLGEDGALKWVLPPLMSTVSSSAHPSGRDSSHMSTTWVIQCCRPGLKHCTSHCLKATILMTLCMWPWACSVMAIQLIQDGPDAIIVAGNRQAGKWSWPCAAGHRPHAICEVGEAGQCHLVVLAIQHYMAGQFDPVVRGSVLRVRSWMVLLGHGVDGGGRDHLCATLAWHSGHLIIAAWWWWSCSGIMMMLWQSPTTSLSQAHLTMYCHLPLQHQVSRMPPVKLVQQYHLLQFQPVEGPIDRLAWHGSHHIGHKASTQKISLDQ